MNARLSQEFPFQFRRHMKTNAVSLSTLKRTQVRATRGLLLLFCLVLPLNGSSSRYIRAADPSSWSLVWSDEFSGSNGSSIDSSKWTAKVGGGGWGNNELEYYTA